MPRHFSLLREGPDLSILFSPVGLGTRWATMAFGQLFVVPLIALIEYALSTAQNKKKATVPT
jgi:hypothetical protein